MKIAREAKTQVLLEALKERYQALHKIRERVQNTSYWTLGFLITASGWIIQSSTLSLNQKSFITFLILAGYMLVRFMYLPDLLKGFQSQQKVTVRIEKALGLFNKNLFTDEKEAIYPESWKKSGNTDGEGKYFITNYRMIDIGVLVFLIALWFQGYI